MNDVMNDVIIDLLQIQGVLELCEEMLAQVRDDELDGVAYRYSSALALAGRALDRAIFRLEGLQESPAA